MIELSVEEINALARGFLTGQGSEAQLQQAQQVLEEDPQFPLELLTQMQSALDDVPPYGFTPEQWQVVDQRVRALYATRVKRQFFNPFAWLAGLFKKRPVPEPTTAAGEAEPKRRWRGGSAPAPAPVTSEGIEDMAPISAAPAPAVTAPKPRAASSFKLDRRVLSALLLLLALLGLGWGAFMAWPWVKAKLAKPAPVAPLPVPTPAPKGPPRRAAPASTVADEPLPAELAPQTVRPAGELSDSPQQAPVWDPTPLGRQAR